MPAYAPGRIQDLLDEVDAAATTAERGAKLEELGRTIFEDVPGLQFYARNLLDGARAHELDLAFWNHQPTSELFFLDPIIIIECKATGHPVGSAQVGWFVRKLQDRGANYGILIALNGITGAADGVSSAHSEVLSALNRDKIRVLILNRAEITGLASSDNTVQLLKGKMLKLTLERTVV